MKIGKCYQTVCFDFDRFSELTDWPGGSIDDAMEYAKKYGYEKEFLECIE